MEKVASLVLKEEEQMDLPPGFRFHPTDEELITHYLYKKVIDTNFAARAIGEVDLNRCEPWDLPWKAKMGEKEWYFFCVRDRKYPTGLRTNRATESGYWKATGKDKEIFRGKSLVGMKKTLVFYKGRAPKGEKTNWVMHEFRLEGKFSIHNLPKTAKNEWVICRVFRKSSAGKKVHISGIMRLDTFRTELDSSGLPPLTETSPSFDTIHDESPYVPCFSNPIDVPRNQAAGGSGGGGGVFGGSFPNNSSSSVPAYAVSSNILPRMPICGGSLYSTQHQDQSILRALYESNEREMISVSQETGLTTEMNVETNSVVSNFDLGRAHFESLWNY
ncbi:hypothetical protein HN51_003256 [Arachis hypogaea]|uniref:NAC domain-containing protein 100 n=1 Tax=Arachis duranensis TaxID=130453 RepID=A0A6P4BIM6_ARADU|nr:NAC domain-containing protein 100 [Arachis duranensis]XP_025618032.1 NAC domain-containing protein 100 [Arachis hypogaea]QHO51613.1 NAC domain-containing protein [Arachis hypogaea]